jgi:signal peptidase II
VNNGRLPDIAGLSTFFDCETLTMANYAPRSLFVWLGIALVILIADQITKLMVIDSFQLGDSQTVTSYFNLVRVHNSGAAFSFLSTASGWQRWFFTAIGVGAAIFIIWLLRSHPSQKLFCFARALVLGGAVGNVIDRLLWGHVIDFLDFHWDWLAPVFYQGHFPAFNVADSAISVGTVCLILDELIRARKSKA